VLNGSYICNETILKLKLKLQIKKPANPKRRKEEEKVFVEQNFVTKDTARI